jgi:hypothetical protein
MFTECYRLDDVEENKITGGMYDITQLRNKHRIASGKSPEKITIKLWCRKEDWFHGNRFECEN